MARRGSKRIKEDKHAVVEVSTGQAKSDEIGSPLQAEATVGDTAMVLPQPIHHRLYWVIGIVTVIVALLLWAGLSLALSRYQVGTARVWALNTAALSRAVTDQAAAYRLSVHYPDSTTKTFTLKDIGYSVDMNSTLAGTGHYQVSQFLTWWRPRQLNIVYKVNQSNLIHFISTSLMTTNQPAEDAHFTVSNNDVQLTDGQEGKQYGLSDPAATVQATTTTLRPSSVALQLLVVSPAVTTEQLANAKDQLKQIVNQPIVFAVAGQTITPSPSDIGDWLEITPSTSHSVDIAVNSGKILSYIASITAPYVHSSRDAMIVNRSDGTSSTLVPGVDGIGVVDESKIATQVAANLLKATGQQVKLTIQTTNYQTVAINNYPKWIEVDTTNKRMYAYEQNTLVRTFLVSAGAPATPTVTGQFKIYSKFVQQDMRGQNADGSHYFQPSVPWINYFYQSYAIHGNYWRPLSWFGRINSSHGCVGVNVSDGAWIYNWAPIGTPVIIHT